MVTALIVHWLRFLPDFRFFVFARWAQHHSPYARRLSFSFASLTLGTFCSMYFFDFRRSILPFASGVRFILPNFNFEELASDLFDHRGPVYYPKHIGYSVGGGGEGSNLEPQHCALFKRANDPPGDIVAPLRFASSFFRSASRLRLPRMAGSSGFGRIKSLLASLVGSVRSLCVID